jgi:hypothetical protein
VRRVGFERVAHNQPDLVLAGVPVSVQLDMLVTVAPKNGVQHVGGTIIQLAKGRAPLPEKAKKEITRLTRIAARAEINRYMAVLIYQHLAANFNAHGTPSRDHCLVFDIFVPTVYPVFGRLEHQVSALEEAAREMVRNWDAIPPPADFDG